MSGSIGGKRIKREEVQPTLDKYIKDVLSKMPGFVSAQITGSYNAGTRKDHGDIDLAVHIKGTNVAQVKKAFKAHLDSTDLPEFVSGKNQGKKSQLYGAIVTCGFPIVGREEDYVQIDNIIVTNENEQRFQRQFLDLDAAKQGLIMGYIRTILHHKDADKILDHIGLVDLPKPGANQEYEFVLSSAGLSFRLVTLNSDMREVNREELWRSANWDLVEYILDPLDLSKSYEELLDEIAKIIKNDNRSKRRIVGIMKSMIKVGPGEVGTPKGDGKIKAIEKAETILKENMIQLRDFIIEGISMGKMKSLEDLRNMLIDRLQDCDEKTLEKINSLLDKEELNMDDVEKFLNQRNLRKCSKMITSIFADHNQIPILIKQMSQEPYPVTSKDFIQNGDKSVGNIYKLFENVGIPWELTDALKNFKQSDKSVARGDFEILLNLFLQDIEIGGSDVPTKLSGKIEVKSKDGMLKGQIRYKISDCDAEFAKHFKKYNVNCTNVFKGMRKIRANLKDLEKKQVPREFVLTSLLKSWCAKYPIEMDNSILDQASKFLIKNQVDIYDKGNEINVGYISDVFMVIDLIMYKNIDKWDNIVAFNKNGNYTVITPEHMSGKFEDIYKIVNKKIKRTTYGTDLEDSRYDAIKIKCIS